MSPNGKEKTGYPQKPLGVLTRIVRFHSNPGDRVLDFFAGSGSFGEAAVQWGRQAVLVDESPEAVKVMKRRFQNFECRLHGFSPECEPATSTDVPARSIPRSDSSRFGTHE